MIMFKKEKYKKYIMTVGILVVLILIEWIINPPFFKSKEISITDVEKIVTLDHYRNKKVYHLIHFNYTLEDGTKVESTYKEYDYPLPKVGDKQQKDVRVTFKEGSFSFGGHIFTLSVILSLLWIANFVILRLFDFMTTKLFLALLVSSIVGIISYVWYHLHNPPVSKSYLENFRVIRVASNIGFYYRDDMSGYRYSELAQQYRKDLRSYYKLLSPKEQKLIWENYLKIYTLQDKIEIVLLFDKNRTYSYDFKSKSYTIDAHFTKLGSQIGLCETIKVDFSSNPKITIELKDKEKLDLVKKNMKESYKLLEINREFKSVEMKDIKGFRQGL